MKTEDRIKKFVTENYSNTSISDLKQIIKFQNMFVVELMKLLCKKYDDLLKGEDLPF